MLDKTKAVPYQFNFRAAQLEAAAEVSLGLFRPLLGAGEVASCGCGETSGCSRGVMAKLLSFIIKSTNYDQASTWVPAL